MIVLHVCGARPNFMKVAPVIRALDAIRATNLVVDTGQHYDPAMSAAFFDDLSLPPPDWSLRVGSGSHSEQTALVMQRLEPILATVRPDLVVVVGDVNSTIAGALVAAKLQLPVAHVEAGLRSFDRSMPEEVNRVLTDQISDLLFTTSPEARSNLLREGIDDDKIHFVGNPMIDSLEQHLPHARRSTIAERLGLTGVAYGLVTLHRPFNVDDPTQLRGLLGALQTASERLPLVFPIHPRTRKVLDAHGIARDDPSQGNLRIIDPLGYVDFLSLIAGARVVITDSGGIQEETTVLGVPCLTLRPNTERPITVEMGTNRLVGGGPIALLDSLNETLRSPMPPVRRPPLWDGRAGERIADVIASFTGSTSVAQPHRATALARSSDAGGTKS